MTIRTVNPYTSYQVLLDLQRTKSQMAKLTEQMSSGSRLTSLGDDPTASALVLDFQNSIDKNSAYIKQAKSAMTFLSTTETALTTLNDDITELLELAEEGVSDTTTADGRSSIAEEVDGILSDILSLSNSQTEGKYIFAGTQTTTQPFSENLAGDIVYAGDSNSIDLNVSSCTTVSTNLTGDEVFFGTGGIGSATDLFQQVQALSDGLTADDTTQIQAAFDNLKTILSRVNDELSKVGGRETALENIEYDLTSYNTSLASIQSSYEGLDYAEAVTEYSQAETAQQASLSVLSNMSNLNLFDYLD